LISLFAYSARSAGSTVDIGAAARKWIEGAPASAAQARQEQDFHPFQ
jgi:hypothetical protein